MARATRRKRVCACPDAILDAPLRVKLAFFKNVIVHHPGFDEVLRKIEDSIESGLPGTMLILVGPAGVGKSSLGDLLHRRVSEAFFADSPDDKHTIPSALIEAWSPEEGRFDWRDFYQQLLQALQAPLIQETLPEVKKVIAGREFWVPDITVRRGATVTALKSRLRLALKMRNPSLIFIDEASAVIGSGSQERVKTKSNTLRSVVNNSNTTMVLSGAYDLYQLVLHTGQLARRGDVIHFPAYLPNQTAEFGKVLVSLQELLPIKGGCDLDVFADELAEQSLRNIGLLKRILTKALAAAERRKRPIDAEILAQCYYKPEQLKVLETEMFDGYLLVEGHRHPNDPRRLSSPATNDKSPSNRDPQKPVRTTHRRVGRTAPARNPIGARHA